jgi:3-oxoadipate enol-lactonase
MQQRPSGVPQSTDNQRMPHHFVDTLHGRLHVFEKGAGIPLLLIHSVGCSVHEYDDVMDRFSARFRTLAIDLPGHGDSGPANRFYSISQYAAAIVETLERLEAPAAHVVGASIGAHIGLESIRMQPTAFRSLVFAEGALLTEAEWSQRWDLVEDTFTPTTHSIEDIAPRFRTADTRLLRRWNIDRRKAGAATMMAAMWALREYRFEAALERLSIPALFLFGDQSPVLGSCALAQAKLPRAKHLLLPGCGHFPMIDDPQAFAEAIMQFIPSREI